MTVWKWLTAFLSGVVLTLGGVWFSYVRGAVSDSEMKDYVSHYSPYVLAVSGIKEQLAGQAAELVEVEKRLDTIEARQIQIRQDVDRVMSRVK